MTITFTDIFCGAGGSSIGLTGAGFELKLAANHWARAIETHSANFRDAEHLCADVSNYDMRRLPRTDVLWASPICTEMSPAGGNGGSRAQQRTAGQQTLEAFGHVEQAGYERTRATFHDVIRATEVHRYRAVLVENVVEVASKWELFDWWVEGMCRLGYRVQYVSVSSAHVGGEGNPRAPQWRDRLYLVFTQEGIRLPDVDPHPLAWCPECDVDVLAVQWWKQPGRRIGKYHAQYLYRCPNTCCRHAVVEPYVAPAAAAIDWSDLGTRIGDRKRPLAAKTRARIEAGLAMFARPPVPVMLSVNHDGDGRSYPADGAPLPARTARIGDGMAVPPGAFITKAYTPRTWDGQMAKSVDEPLGAITASGGNQGVVIPMLVPAGGTWRDDASPVDVPMGARTARETDALVCPPFIDVARTNNRSRGVDEPLAPLTTGRNHGLVCPPFVAELRGGSSTARSIDDPLATVTAGGLHHGLTVPPGSFYVKNYGGNAEPTDMVKGVGQPLGTITARTSLVIPFRRGARPYPAGSEPLSTIATREAHALLQAAIDVDDCLFRMLKPREHLRAQRFPDAYLVTGNKGEQTMQAGNAVSANVPHWLGLALAAVL
jgi:DNA (cytosine-5)-methyltransferase 1